MIQKESPALQLIRLKNVEPGFLNKNDLIDSQIWTKDKTVHSGIHYYIVAPSGTGKTSLIHFIYGLRNDYKGAIYYNDRQIKNFSAEDFSSYRQKNISIIFQDLRLFTEQTIRENIEIKRTLQPFYPAEKTEEMADALGIRKKLDQVAGTCSFGEQQRAAIIRALVQPFDFLLLDEPFSHLDKINRMKAMDLILRECNHRKATMFLADLDGAMLPENDAIKINL